MINKLPYKDTLEKAKVKHLKVFLSTICTKKQASLSGNNT